MQRMELPAKNLTNEAIEKANLLRKLHEQLVLDIDFVAKRVKEYYDKRHQEAPQFKEGEKVFLLQQNIKTKRPSDKLDFKKLGPFEILQKTEPVNYKLRLPDTVPIHPNFHVSLLEKAPGNAQQYKTEVDNEEQEYEVETILEKQRISNKHYYLVKWKGYDTSENTWEPEENLKNARKKVEHYDQKDQARKGQAKEDHQNR